MSNAISEVENRVLKLLKTSGATEAGDLTQQGAKGYVVRVRNEQVRIYYVESQAPFAAQRSFISILRPLLVGAFGEARVGRSSGMFRVAGKLRAVPCLVVNAQ